MRKEIFLVSKVTTNFSRRHVFEALQASLERLQTDHLDLYLFHSFDTNTPLEEALAAMLEVRRAGLTRFIGCSNFTVEQMQQALTIGEGMGIELHVVEGACNLALGDSGDLLRLCAGKNLGFLAYSPLAAGFLTGKYSGDPSQIPPGSRFHVIPGHADIYFIERSFGVLAELQALEKTTGIPSAQLAIAWVLAHSAVTSVLCGARRIAHLANALSAANLQLPADWKWPRDLSPAAQFPK
jgi:aryl-alcohol dehydrogenase-like predicted oxidoreductase